MIYATREEFAWLMHELAVALGAKPPREQVEVYFRQLGRYPRGVLLSAVAEVIRTQKFFPAPAELRAIADRTAGERSAARDAMVTFVRDWPGADFDADFNDASAWRLYTTGKASSDELDADDIRAIYADLKKHDIAMEEGL